MSGTEFSRRSFVKYAGLAGAACMASVVLASCGQSAPSSSASSQASGSLSASDPSASAASQPSAVTRGKSIVVFFSRAGENSDVGYVEEGNTAKVAFSIAGKIVSDVFEIVPEQPYPESYDECVQVALSELETGARPAYLDDIPDFASYDVVYLGYPIWCEHVPSIVMSFVEAHDWSGKTVVPFCTYGSSGVLDTVETLQAACPGATFAKPLGLTGAVAQNDAQQMDAAVNEWLASVRS